MIKESKPIDVKSLILYSLVLIAVVAVSYIFIRVPSKKTVTTAVPTTVQSTQPENGSQINRVKSGWQLYEGNTFNINHLIGYTPQESSTPDLVSFTSGENSKLTVYYPEDPAANIPSDFIVDEQTEDIVNEIKGKNPTCTAQLCSREIITVDAKDKSYTKRIMINKNDAEKLTMAFAFQYVPGASDSEVSDIFNYFQQSLVRRIQ